MRRFSLYSWVYGELKYTINDQTLTIQIHKRKNKDKNKRKEISFTLHFHVSHLFFTSLLLALTLSLALSLPSRTYSRCNCFAVFAAGNEIFNGFPSIYIFILLSMSPFLSLWTMDS